MSKEKHVNDETPADQPAPDSGNTPVEDLVEDLTEEELAEVTRRLQEEGL